VVHGGRGQPAAVRAALDAIMRTHSILVLHHDDHIEAEDWAAQRDVPSVSLQVGSNQEMIDRTRANAVVVLADRTAGDMVQRGRMAGLKVFDATRPAWRPTRP
jgi:hypothetical protein